MSEKDNQKSGFVIFLRGLLRLILVLLVGFLVGAGIYMAGNYLFQQAIYPTQQNTSQISKLNERMEEQWNLSQQRNQDIENRIVSLENGQTVLEDHLAEVTTNLNNYQQDLENLTNQQEDLQTRLDDIETSIDDLKKAQNELANVDEQISETLAAQSKEEILQPVWNELNVLKVMQQINRSRTFLLEDNYGMARQELEIANKIIETLLTQVPENESDQVLLWKARNDLAMSHLPENPVLAREDLEILWNLLADGFSQTTSEMSTESSASLEPQPTATIEQTPSVTPTPTSTP